MLVGRIRAETLERSKQFACRMLDVAETLEAQRRSRRIVEQVIAAGTSVGANLHEASEALSRKDFIKLLGICVKELAECTFWLELLIAKQWLTPDHLSGLLNETRELKLMLGAMISRSRKTPATTRS